MKRFTAFLAALSGILLTAASLPAQSPSQRLVLDRKGETIVLEPYAPNILRVTLSLKHDPAVAAPGFGFVAAPEARVHIEPILWGINAGTSFQATILALLLTFRKASAALASLPSLASFAGFSGFAGFSASGGFSGFGVGEMV